MAIKATAEFINTNTEFKWRIVYGDETSKWSRHYDGLLVYKFSDGRTFGLATQYWEGSLPTEIPFEIIEQEQEVKPESITTDFACDECGKEIPPSFVGGLGSGRFHAPDCSLYSLFGPE